MTAGKGKNLLWRLLRKHVSPLQLAGFSIASLVGLTIVVLALQFYVDVKPVFSDEDSFARRDYIVVTKHVSGLGSMFGSGVEFSESDIADLESQPWVREVGRFTTSEYGIYASVMFGGVDYARNCFSSRSQINSSMNCPKTGDLILQIRKFRSFCRAIIFHCIILDLPLPKECLR